MNLSRFRTNNLGNVAKWLLRLTRMVTTFRHQIPSGAQVRVLPLSIHKQFLFETFWLSHLIHVNTLCSTFLVCSSFFFSLPRLLLRSRSRGKIPHAFKLWGEEWNTYVCSIGFFFGDLYHIIQIPTSSCGLELHVYVSMNVQAFVHVTSHVW